MAARQVPASLLAIVAALCGVGGGIAWYLRDEVVDRRAFADRAVAALDRPVVHDAVVSEIAGQLQRRVPAAFVSRERLAGFADRLVRTRGFRREFRRGAADVHRVLFDGTAEEADLRVGGLSAALAQIDPRLATLLGSGATTQLLTLRRGDLGVSTVRLADGTETAAVALPVASLAALVLALLLAPNRRGVVRVAAVATAGFAGLALLGLSAGRAGAEERAEPSSGLTVEDARLAVGEAWDVYTGDLRTPLLIAIAGGIVVAAVTLVPRRRTA